MTSDRKAFAFALAAGMCGALALIEACGGAPGASTSGGGNGGSSGGGSTGTGDGGVHPAVQCQDGGTNAVSTTAGSCPNPTLSIVFTPMHSAYIPGDTLRSFYVPAVTSDGCAAKWSLSDPTQASLHVQSFVAGGVTTPGVMITPKGTGQVTVFAESGGSCGSAVLSITKNTEDDWTIGNARYNHGVSLHAPSGAGAPDSGYFTSAGGPFLASDGGEACSTCHSQSVKTGQYTDVAHTPEQTAGFSDDDMKNIILKGEVPDGGYFDPAVITASCTNAGTTLSPNMPACGLSAYAQFRTFHQWNDIAPDQVAGMICYLRSLLPEGQNGTSNFGGGH